MKKKEIYQQIKEKAEDIIFLLQIKESGILGFKDEPEFQKKEIQDILEESNVEIQKIFKSRIEQRINQNENEFNNILKSLRSA